MSKRFIVKETRENKRGESGTIPVWYVWDTISKTKLSGTCGIKSEVEKLAKDFDDITKLTSSTAYGHTNLKV